MTFNPDQFVVVSEFLTDDQKFLIQKTAFQLVGKKPSKKPIEVGVRSLGRFGKSGARLLLCRIDGGFFFVLKIHDQSDIEAEHEAITALVNFFEDARTATKPAYHKGLGSLLYWHVAGGTEKQIEGSHELADGVFEWGDAKVRRIFRRIEERCEVARSKALSAPQPISLRVEYDRYLRRNQRTGVDRPTEILSCMFGRHRADKQISFLGEKILNPITFLGHKCFTQERLLRIGPIHGDLHPSNVIISKDSSVRLIDFAWGNEAAHVIKDYLLMECSLRFMLFPHHINLEEQLEVDRLLLRTDGPEKLRAWRRSSPLCSQYRRLGMILSILRKQAAEQLVTSGEKGFLEYLAGQFLMLYGLVKYEDYNRFVAVRALGLTAKYLLERGFC